MRKRLIWTLTLGAVIAMAFAGISMAKPVVVSLGNLVLKFDSSISPKALPKKEFAPISFKLSANISTKDGKHPPAAKTFSGRHRQERPAQHQGPPGLQSRAQLEARPTAQAEAACKDSLIGKGTASAEVEFAEQAPFTATGPLRVFNGGTKGNKTLVLVHVYANVPAPTAFITKVFVTKEHKGKFGYHIDSTIPVVAGGSGSLTNFSITNKKIFTYKGKKQSYFLAKCPTGSLFGEGEVSFTNGDRLKGSVVVPCTPKG